MLQLGVGDSSGVSADSSLSGGDGMSSLELMLSSMVDGDPGVDTFLGLSLLTQTILVRQLTEVGKQISFYLFAECAVNYFDLCNHN